MSKPIYLPLHTLADDPMVVRNLAAAIQQIPTAMQVYKNLLFIWTALLSYLERVAAQSTANFQTSSRAGSDLPGTSMQCPTVKQKVGGAIRSIRVGQN